MRSDDTPLVRILKKRFGGDFVRKMGSRDERRMG